MAGGTLETQLIISAQDKTGVVIDALITKIEALEKIVAGLAKAGGANGGMLGKGFEQAARGAADAARNAERLGQAVNVVARHGSALDRVARGFANIGAAAKGAIGHMGQMASHVAAMSGVPVGAGMAYGVVKATEAGADLEQLKFRLREVSRNDPGEAATAERLAHLLASQYPSVTTAKVLDTYLELRPNAEGNGKVDPEKAARNVAVATRAQAASTALGFDMTPVDMQNLIKSVEGSGRASDPKAVEKITDAYLRAKQVFGSAIASSMIRDYVANAKAANFSIGDDPFYLQTMVRMTEGNASRLGNEVNQTMQTLVGGSMKKATGLWLAGLGLVDPSQIEPTGGDSVRIRGGVKGADQLQTDQMGWANSVLLPGIERTGALSDEKVGARMAMLRAQELSHNPNAQIDEHFLRTRAEEGLISAEIQKSGARGTVVDNLAHLIANARLINRDIEQLQNASGSGAADRLGQNPVAAFKQLGSSISDFAAIVASPAVSAAAPLMDGLAHSLAGMSKGLSEFYKDHPEQAKYISGGALGAAAAGGASAAGWTAWKGLEALGLAKAGSATAWFGSLFSVLSKGSALALPLALSGDTQGQPGGISADEAKRREAEWFAAHPSAPRPMFYSVGRSLRHAGYVPGEVEAESLRETSRARAFSGSSDTNQHVDVAVSGTAQIQVDIRPSREFDAILSRMVEMKLTQSAPGGVAVNNSGPGSTGASQPDQSRYSRIGAH